MTKKRGQRTSKKKLHINGDETTKSKLWRTSRWSMWKSRGKIVCLWFRTVLTYYTSFDLDTSFDLVQKS
jgi:hypothetical protein